MFVFVYAVNTIILLYLCRSLERAGQLVEGRLFEIEPSDGGGGGGKHYYRISCVRFVLCLSCCMRDIISYLNIFLINHTRLCPHIALPWFTSSHMYVIASSALT